MSAIRRSVSLLALALGSAAIAFAGENQTRPVDRPVVTRVAHRMAYSQDNILVEGRGLGVVYEARLDGAVLPVVNNNGHRLLIAVPAQDPGFGELQLVYPRGVVNAVAEFTPTVAVDHKPRTIDVYINGGGDGHNGFYVLNYSFRIRALPVRHPGINYMEWLDMSSPFSGIVGADLFRGGPALEVFKGERLGLLNRPVFFQAICTTHDGEMTYTNAVCLRHGHIEPSDGL